VDTLREKRRHEELLKVAEQAAEWLIVLEEGRPEERAAFAEWMEESPLHVEMFLRASAVDQMNELLSAEDRQRLLERAGMKLESNVVALEPSPSATRRETTESLGPNSSPARGSTGLTGRFGWLAAIAAAAATVAVGIWWFVEGPGSWEAHTTAVGEQRTVALSDGSLVYVNTDTRIDVRYSAGAREVRLRRGEALFKVAQDAARPFQVHIEDTTVRALGTEFNIYRRLAETRVAVIEGAVQVSKDQAAPYAAVSAPASTSPSSPGSVPKRLVAGEGIDLLANGRAARPVRINVAQAIAWRQRRLVFEWETLETIAAEFNRYNRAPHIRVEGDVARTRRYTAVFDADNPQTLLKFLARDSDLVFGAEGDDFVIRAR
jgi:transmembrane sensor